jgi:hypothetical protein
MDIDRSLDTGIGFALKAIQQFATRIDSAWRGDQNRQQLELRWREINRAASDLNLAARAIEHDIAGAQDIRRLGGWARAS